jgi:hypothetical protein
MAIGMERLNTKEFPVSRNRHCLAVPETDTAYIGGKDGHTHQQIQTTLTGGHKVAGSLVFPDKRTPKSPVPRVKTRKMTISIMVNCIVLLLQGVLL